MQLMIRGTQTSTPHGLASGAPPGSPKGARALRPPASFPQSCLVLPLPLRTLRGLEDPLHPGRHPLASLPGSSVPTAVGFCRADRQPTSAGVSLSSSAAPPALTPLARKPPRKSPVLSVKGKPLNTYLKNVFLVSAIPSSKDSGFYNKFLILFHSKVSVNVVHRFDVNNICEIYLKVCLFYFRDMGNRKDTMLAQVGQSQSFQEFCNSTCLSLYEARLEKGPTQPPKPSAPAQRCSVCNHMREVPKL